MSQPGAWSGDAERSEHYWRANLRLKVKLLAVWAIVGYVLAILLAEPLNEIVIGGFPLGFWIAQQGSIITFVVLIFIYAKRMDRIDEDHGVHEQELGDARKPVAKEIQGGLSGGSTRTEGDDRP